jgi:hypothetical protein
VAPTYALAQFLTKGNGETVNCYDLAASVTVLANLIGANAEYRYLGAPGGRRTFGYLNETSLIGRGQSNNPFFSSGGVDHNPVVGADSCFEDFVGVRRWARSFFGNHAFVLLGSTAKVYDANVGPVLGADNVAGYLATAVDSNDAPRRTCNAARAGQANGAFARATITLR